MPVASGRTAQLLRPRGCMTRRRIFGYYGVLLRTSALLTAAQRRRWIFSPGPRVCDSTNVATNC
jgi:hypothetical protein